MDERISRAGLEYERAVFSGDAGPLEEAGHGLDGVDADLCLARGKMLHGRFLLRRGEHPGPGQEAAGEGQEAAGELALFERAARLYRGLGDVRGEAEALFWTGCFHQVVARDNRAAVPVLERSLELASQAGDLATMSEALRHLGIAAHFSGQFEAARQRLEQSTLLRRESGNLRGVASNQVGLAYIAMAEGRPQAAGPLLDEATEIARAAGAARLLAAIDEARAVLAGA
jgi:tetratricopeptide (TPR) repeat protein